MKRTTLIICAGVLSLFTQAQSFVTINNDPTSTAMGETGVSIAASGFSIYNNTASTVVDTTTWAAVYSYSPYMWNFASGNNLHTVAGFYKLGLRHSLAAGVRYFNKADVMLTNDEGENAGIARPIDLSVEIGYAFKMNEHMSLAANVRLVRSNLDVPDAKGTAVGFDVGYYLRKKGLRLGVLLSNVGSQIEYNSNKYDMPSWLKVGGSYKWLLSNEHALMGSIQCDYNFQPDSEKGFSSGVGVEYSYKKLAFLRGGYRLASNLMGYNYTTLGMGCNVSLVSLNFAYIVAGSSNPIDKTILISMGINI